MCSRVEVAGVVRVPCNLGRKGKASPLIVRSHILSLVGTPSSSTENSRVSNIVEDGHQLPTIVECECPCEQILALIDCLEVKKDQTGVDDDWEVSFLQTF